jgi:hypothetical protein
MCLKRSWILDPRLVGQCAWAGDEALGVGVLRATCIIIVGTKGSGQSVATGASWAIPIDVGGLDDVPARPRRWLRRLNSCVLLDGLEERFLGAAVCHAIRLGRRRSEFSRSPRDHHRTAAARTGRRGNHMCAYVDVKVRG